MLRLNLVCDRPTTSAFEVVHNKRRRDPQGALYLFCSYHVNPPDGKRRLLSHTVHRQGTESSMPLPAAFNRWLLYFFGIEYPRLA